MGTITKQGTITVNPSSYDTTSYSWASVSSQYPMSNAYTDSSSTTYAQVSLKTGANAETYFYLIFDLSPIPANATITSISCSAKGYINTTNSSRITARQMQLFSGTTAKGSAATISTSTSAQNLTCGSWTRSELNNCRLRFYVKRGTSNTSSTYNIRAYGATLTVNYSWQETTYTITVSGTGASPSGSNEVVEGESFTVRVDQEERPVIKDNGVDVSNQATKQQDEPASYTVETASGVNYGFSLNSSGYYESTNKGRASSTALSVVTFNVPVAATITFRLINYAESTYDFGLLSNIDGTLSTNASADSSYYWSGKNNNSSSVQTVTYQMSAGTHTIYVKYFKDQYTDSYNDSLQFKVEITLNESWSPAEYWAYVISNVSADHTVVVSIASQDVLLFKRNGSWVTATKAYKKVNGVWVEQSDLSAVFSASVNYVVGN